MIIQRYRTVRACNYLPAAFAAYDSIVSAAVKKQDSLISLVRHALELADKAGAKRRTSQGVLISHIVYHYLRQRRVAVSALKTQQLVLSLNGFCVALNGRSRGRQKHYRAVISASPTHYVPCMIFRRGLGLICRLVLFVYYKQTGIFYRGKHRGPCSYHYIGLTGSYPFVCVLPLTGRQSGMHQRHPVSEICIKFSYSLRR